MTDFAIRNRINIFKYLQLKINLYVKTWVTCTQNVCVHCNALQYKKKKLQQIKMSLNNYRIIVFFMPPMFANIWIVKCHLNSPYSLIACFVWILVDNFDNMVYFLLKFCASWHLREWSCVISTHITTQILFYTLLTYIFV